MTESMEQTQQVSSGDPEAKEKYPARYYAQYDLTVKEGPAPITGWYDMWGYSSLAGLPPASQLFPLTEEYWQDHLSRTTANNPQTLRAILNGEIVDYAPEPTPIPLAQQANALVASARETFTELQMQGKSFGPMMQKYMTKLIAISKGTDTASTDLPTQPSDPTT